MVEEFVDFILEFWELFFSENGVVNFLMGLAGVMSSLVVLFMRGLV